MSTVLPINPNFLKDVLKHADIIKHHINCTKEEAIIRATNHVYMLYLSEQNSPMDKLNSFIDMMNDSMFKKLV